MEQRGHVRSSLDLSPSTFVAAVLVAAAVAAVAAAVAMAMSTVRWAVVMLDRAPAAAAAAAAAAAFRRFFLLGFLRFASTSALRLGAPSDILPRCTVP